MDGDHILVAKYTGFGTRYLARVQISAHFLSSSVTVLVWVFWEAHTKTDLAIQQLIEVNAYEGKWEIAREDQESCQTMI